MEMIVVAGVRRDTADSAIIEEDYPHAKNRISINHIHKLLGQSTRVSWISERRWKLATVASKWANIYFKSILVRPMSGRSTTAQ